jgi:uncharacterized protein YdeI (YjbR/CyaY-like superfamily)
LKLTPENITYFRAPANFRKWLEKNHAKKAELWVGFYKKGSGKPGITWPESVDQALCFGWIDGQKLPGDDQSWLQKFTPRRPGSGWSKRNTDHAQRLIESGEMTAAGLREIVAAKADGRWESAYDAFGSATVPEDFLTELARNRKAHTFFKTLNKTNLFSIVYRLQTAKKPETREKRKQTIIAMLARGEKFH